MAESRTGDYSTVIGADAKFKGELEFDGAAKVLGSFEGAIKAKGRIHIANGSDCRATVEAKEVEVEGHVQGDVNAADRIELKQGGVVVGDIHAARMTMAEGASINGHCHIGPNGGTPNGNGKSAATAEAKPDAAPAKAAASRK